MNLEARLTKLESRQVAALGIRIFRTTDDVNYFESTGDGYDYLEAITGLDGNPPNDGRRLWTRAELDALEREGWQLIVICYVKNWREMVNQAIDEYLQATQGWTLESLRGELAIAAQRKRERLARDVALMAGR